MKKFKKIFYPVYGIVIVLVLIMSYNIYDALELFKSWGWFKYFSDLPFMARNLMVFLCLLMVTEWVLENIHILRLRSKEKEQAREITDLKAKLYDRIQEEGPEESPEEENPEAADEDEYEF